MGFQFASSQEQDSSETSDLQEQNPTLVDQYQVCHQRGAISFHQIRKTVQVSTVRNYINHSSQDSSSKLHTHLLGID